MGGVLGQFLISIGAYQLLFGSVYAISHELAVPLYLDNPLTYFNQLDLVIGILHGFDIAGAIIFGYLCGCLYLKYQCLWASVLLHTINNTLACLIQWNQVQNGTTKERLSDSLMSQLMIGSCFLLIGIISLFFS